MFGPHPPPSNYYLIFVNYHLNMSHRKEEVIELKVFFKILCIRRLIAKMRYIYAFDNVFRPIPEYRNYATYALKTTIEKGA
jgi:hypothetical protein